MTEQEHGEHETPLTERCKILRFKDVKLPPPYVKAVVGTRLIIMSHVENVANFMAELEMLGIKVTHYQERARKMEAHFDEMRELFWEDTGEAFDQLRWLSRAEKERMDALEAEMAAMEKDLDKAKKIWLNVRKRLEEAAGCENIKPSHLRSVRKYAHMHTMQYLIEFAADPQAMVERHRRSGELARAALEEGHIEDAEQHLGGMYSISSDNLAIEKCKQEGRVVEVFPGEAPADQERAPPTDDHRQRFKIVECSDSDNRSASGVDKAMKGNRR